MENKDERSWVSNIYTILSAMFTITLCCMCVIGCCKCFLHKGGSIDFEADDADPDWDRDQMRIYQMRRLQR